MNRQRDQQAEVRPRQLGTIEHTITRWSGIACTKMTPTFRYGPSQQISAAARARKIALLCTHIYSITSSAPATTAAENG